jgi:hypothetical protein
MVLIEEDFELLDGCKADRKIGKVGNLKHNSVFSKDGRSAAQYTQSRIHTVGFHSPKAQRMAMAQ